MGKEFKSQSFALFQNRANKIGRNKNSTIIKMIEKTEKCLKMRTYQNISFLVGAFLEKRVDYSHGFSSVFLRPPELTKIVLPKVLQNFKFHLLAQGTEPKSFPHNIQCRTRPKDPPFQFFSALRDFFSEKNFPKGSPLQFFLLFCDRKDVEKFQRVPPFNFFRRCETFF